MDNQSSTHVYLKILLTIESYSHIYLKIIKDFKAKRHVYRDLKVDSFRIILKGIDRYIFY